jgi:hypothetical protein
VAAVALANNARIICALLTRGENYRSAVLDHSSTQSEFKRGYERNYVSPWLRRSSRR